MKKLIFVTILGFLTTSFADVCQIKPSQNQHGSANIYSLSRGDVHIATVTDSFLDLKNLVDLRDLLITNDVCRAEINLESCSVGLDFNSMINVIIRIGNTELTRYATQSADATLHSLNVAAETIKTLRSYKVCK